MHEAAYGGYYFSNFLDVMMRTGPLIVTHLAETYPLFKEEIGVIKNFGADAETEFKWKLVRHMEGSSWHQWDSIIISFIYNYPYRFLMGIVVFIVILTYRPIPILTWKKVN